MWTHILICFLCVYGCRGSDSRIVNTAEGPVKGYKDAGGGLFAFYNIPYAKAPTGRDRFKAPLPAPVRPYTLEAIDKGIICPQTSDLLQLFNRSFVMTEDCLIANVFVPDTKKINLPVLVYVHGGGYILGHGDLISYKNFIKTKDVIIVNFNYRVGVHGFLCLGTEDVPGNAGMKDQVALLRWVKQNIVNFGGNPDDVAIAGYSAGSSSVDLLMLSKMTKGLFNKVIPESGANTAAWSVQTDPIRVAQEYGKYLNFTNVNDLNALEEFYKTVSYEILNTVGLKLLNRPDSVFLMSPCVERDTEGEEFLIDSPVNILKSGNYVKVPMLYGFAEMEGLLRVEAFEQWKNLMNEKFIDFLPPDLHFSNNEEKNMVANKIRKFYFGDTPINEDNILNYVNFFSDVLFTFSTLRSVKLHVEAGHDKIYLYVYSFVHEGLPIIPHTKIRGANHCAQSVDMADGNFTHPDDNIMPQESINMKKVVRELWYNFITTGQPVPEGSVFPAWPPVGKNWSPHMVIDNPLRLGDSLLKQRTQFWEEIYDKYYQKPSAPGREKSIPRNTEL